MTFSLYFSLFSILYMTIPMHLSHQAKLKQIKKPKKGEKQNDILRRQRQIALRTLKIRIVSKHILSRSVAELLLPGKPGCCS